MYTPSTPTSDNCAGVQKMTNYRYDHLVFHSLQNGLRNMSGCPQAGSKFSSLASAAHTAAIYQMQWQELIPIFSLDGAAQN